MKLRKVNVFGRVYLFTRVGVQWYITLQHTPGPSQATPPWLWLPHPKTWSSLRMHTWFSGRGTSLLQGLPPRGTSLYRELHLYDIFKPFHYQLRMVHKWAVHILLEDFLARFITYPEIDVTSLKVYIVNFKIYFNQP